MKHVEIRVEGCVQGVGFRWWARAKAAALGIKGFVRNEDDGSVYLEVEGEDAAVDAYVDVCRRGPGGAMVDRITVSEGPMRRHAEFEIRFR